MTDLPTTMTASVLTGKQALHLEQRPVPTPDADQVLIRVTAVGVCGSDVHFWHDGGLGRWTSIDEPLVLGHESGGTIVAVGADVDPGRVGQRVSIEPQRPSTTSRETLAGRYNLDPDMQFYAVPGTDGAFQQYVTIQAHFAWPVPDSISDEAAALMEPLSVGIASVQKAGVSAGSRVLIAGAGPIGVVTAQVARAFGATEIIISDVSAARLEQALTFGATRAIDPREEDIATLGLDVDAFIDASGAPSAILAGMAAVRPGGTLVLTGIGAKELTIPMPMLQDRELVITGVFRYANTWPIAIDLVRAGRVDLDRMVTGHYPLSELEAAFRSTREPDTMKSIVSPQA